MPLQRHQRITVPAGESAVLIPSSAPWSLSLSPGAGGTVAAAVTLSDPEDVAALWHDLEEAALDADKLYIFPGPVAGIRVTAATAAAAAELLI